MQAKELLIYLSLKHKGKWDSIFKDISEKVEINNDEAEETLKEFYKSGNKVITILDEEYPDRLKDSYKPPFVLFYIGDINILNNTEEVLGVMGKEDVSDVMVDNGSVVSLMGDDCVELKSKDGCLFLSTSYDRQMTKTERAKLFINLTSQLNLISVKETTLVSYILIMAIQEGVPIVSTKEPWLEELNGKSDYITFIDYEKISQ